MLRFLGAKLELTPGDKGMGGAIARAEQLQKVIPGSIVLQQFENPANPAIHKVTTAEEIWQDTAGAVDIVVAGIGTGGTITGVGEVLKRYKPSVDVARVSGFSRWQMFSRLLMPAALPSLFNGFYLALVFSWLATQGAEYMRPR